jgi:hypothetical protein
MLMHRLKYQHWSVALFHSVNNTLEIKNTPDYARALQLAVC